MRSPVGAVDEGTARVRAADRGTMLLVLHFVSVTWALPLRDLRRASRQKLGSIRCGWMLRVGLWAGVKARSRHHKKIRRPAFGTRISYRVPVTSTSAHRGQSGADNEN